MTVECSHEYPYANDLTDYDFYSIAYENNSALVTPGNNWLIIRSPGNTKKSNTISFQTPDGRWLKEDNNKIVVEAFQDTEKFKEATTFCTLNGLANTHPRTSFSFVSSTHLSLYMTFKPPGSFMLLMESSISNDKYATWFFKKDTGRQSSIL